MNWTPTNTGRCCDRLQLLVVLISFGASNIRQQSATTDGKQGCRRGINTGDRVLVPHRKAPCKWFTPRQLHKPEKNNWETSKGPHSFPSPNDTRLRRGRLPSGEVKVAAINLLAPFSSTSNRPLLIWWRKNNNEGIQIRLNVSTTMQQKLSWEK